MYACMFVHTEQRVGEHSQPPGQYGPPRGGASWSPGTGGAPPEGRSLTQPQEQEAADAA